MNIKADFQKTQSDLVDQERASKELKEENEKLKAENESILQNLERDRVNHAKFEAEHEDTISKINSLQIEIQQRDSTVAELRASLHEFSKQVKIKYLRIGL